MDDKALLEAIGQMMDAKLAPINERLDKLQEDVAELKEDIGELKEEHSMTREGVNKLLDWADTAGYIIKFPLDKAN